MNVYYFQESKDSLGYAEIRRRSADYRNRDITIDSTEVADPDYRNGYVTCRDSVNRGVRPYQYKNKPTRKNMPSNAPLDHHNIQNIVGAFGVRLRNGQTLSPCMFESISGENGIVTYTVRLLSDNSQKRFMAADVESAWRA